ncbi:BAF_HP2_G0015600.mRNA.1.CDS.1 [Saccharomyces cerevisiae]|nr:BAF_HP2_G0015600.mRNA.1.CDS.1 [Saccharomyces cerevisiae]CAI6598618.1 BAF_HP2_G0015600.mRNA.1.CDS.1 [Saccharomyces cerevisiae]
MKSIYRTSVLVNDSNLMTRTKEAIELSKVLKNSDVATPLKQQRKYKTSFKICIKFPRSRRDSGKSSIKFSQAPSTRSHSRTSVTDFTASQQRRQHMNKRFSTRRHSTSALFMNPAFMPPE